MEHRATLPDRVSLRIISFHPPSERYCMPVIMLPGLVSVMRSFKYLLLELTSSFVVHYVETREKSSSLAPDDADFSISQIGKDIIEVLSDLDVKDKQYILFGASLCATAIIDCYRNLKVMPFCMVLIEPNASFDYPKWGLLLIRFSRKIDHLMVLMQKPLNLKMRNSAALKGIAKWYIKNFRVNKKEDFEMYRISSRAIDAASPARLKKTVLSIYFYKIWSNLKYVHTPILLVTASKDKFHRHDDLLKMSSLLENCTYLDLESHKRTNGAEFVYHFRAFLDNLITGNPWSDKCI